MVGEGRFGLQRRSSDAACVWCGLCGGRLPLATTVATMCANPRCASESIRSPLPSGPPSQIPLQPLKDNLESATYEVFEKDPVKYVQYENAVCGAIKKRHAQKVRNQSVSQSVSQSLSHSVCLSIGQSVGPSASYCVLYLLSVCPRVCRSVCLCLWVCRSGSE